MRYNLILKNRKEIMVDFSQEEIEALWKEIKERAVKMIKIDGAFYNISEISTLEPSGEAVPISKEFRLEAQTPRTLDEKKLEQIAIVKRMDELWHNLKKQGMFKEYKAPDEFRKKYVKL